MLSLGKTSLACCKVPFSRELGTLAILKSEIKAVSLAEGRTFKIGVFLFSYFYFLDVACAVCLKGISLVCACVSKVLPSPLLLYKPTGLLIIESSRWKRPLRSLGLAVNLTL